MFKKLGEKIKQLRNQKEITQEYVAKELGLSRPTYASIERGAREPKPSELQKLADIFGIQAIKAEDFFSGTGQDIPVVLERKKIKASKKKDIRISVPQKNIEKFKETLLYILEKVGAKPNIGETAIYKLLYFIDFDFYEKYEQQLIGATYQKNKYGPTPVEFKKIVDEMIRDNELEMVKSKYFQYDQKKYLPHRSPDLTKLSALELTHIDDVLCRLSDKSAKELSEYSHGDLPWLVHEDGEIISYESVFYRDYKYSVKNYPDEV